MSIDPHAYPDRVEHHHEAVVSHETAVSHHYYKEKAWEPTHDENTRMFAINLVAGLRTFEKDNVPETLVRSAAIIEAYILNGVQVE